MAGGGGAWKGALEITDVLDIKLVKQQIDAKGFDWAARVNLVQAVMHVLNKFEGGGASAGHPEESSNSGRKVTWGEVEKALEYGEKDALTQPAAFCSGLEFLLDRTKAVRIEVANSRLRLIAPTIKDHGAEYERNHTSKKLREGTLTLSRMHTWLRATIKEEIQSGRVMLHNLTTSNVEKGASFRAILNAGAVSLITGPKPVSAVDCPETFLLDMTRLVGMNKRFRMISLVSSILVVVGQKLSKIHDKNTSTILDSIAKNMMSQVDTARTVTELLVSVSDALSEFSEMEMADSMRLCLEVLKTVHIPEDVLPALMQKRVHAVLVASLLSQFDLFTSENTIAASFKEFSLPKSTYAIAPHLRDLSRALRGVLKTNVAVHGSRYNTIIPVEAEGLVMSRVRINDDDPAPLGYRKVASLEATARLDELTKANSLTGATIVRLAGGRMDQFKDNYIELFDGTMAPMATKWVVGLDKVEGLAQTLVVPISIDLIALKPGEAAPAGFRLVSAMEAGSERWKKVLVKDRLQEFSIARLNGGKIDGHGYGGVVTPGDFSRETYIGEALVTPL